MTVSSCRTGTHRSCSTRCCSCPATGSNSTTCKNFRQWGSATPGHPEAGHTAGVEVTTGPLGQGFANAVGMAIAEENLRARFGAEAQDHYTFVIAGDGCLMEGISHEAASLAGHLGLGKLICVFDDNLITIDGPTSMSTGDDTATRFRSYGWDVVDLGEMADDLDGLEAALDAAKAADRQAVAADACARTSATPPPTTPTPHGAHGNPFAADDVTRTKEVMGIPDEPFWAPDELVAAYRSARRRAGRRRSCAWAERQRRRHRVARVAGGVGRHRHRRVGRRSAHLRPRRVGRHPQSRSRRRSTPPTTGSPA